LLLTPTRYSFCRVADDLVDNARTQLEARQWISNISHYLDLAYASKEARMHSKHPDLHTYIKENFPESSQSALRLLPTHLLPFGPLYDLLEGFKTDLEFSRGDLAQDPHNFPITNGHELEVYAARVAGTVAELCLELVFHHSPTATTNHQREQLVHSGGHMGIALQYINIARDIAIDAKLGRVYLPTTWLEEEGLSPRDVLEQAGRPSVEKLRQKLLGKAFDGYRDAQSAMSQLPAYARAPMRVAVESYMEIGRVLKERGYKTKHGRATVPKLRRLKVAWRTLSE
jgi:15-cis-phytoene synthase/lycopene beta-cyclase